MHFVHPPRADLLAFRDRWKRLTAIANPRTDYDTMIPLEELQYGGPTIQHRWRQAARRLLRDCVYYLRLGARWLCYVPIIIVILCVGLAVSLEYNLEGKEIQ